jgi:phosphatidyl-myo-inositol alpha-mannosyltransferase
VKVALACSYAWDAPGGVQVHVRQLAARLREGGHEVLVLAPMRGSPRERFVVAVGRPVRVPFNGSIAPIAPWPSSARRVARALGEFGPDVVHAHEPLVPSAGMFASRYPGAPVVATFHAYADRAYTFSLLAPLLRPVWRRLSARIAVSEAAAMFVRSRFRQDGLRVIPNGVDTDLFARAEPASLPEGRRVLFVNRLEPRKGFGVMVQAFRRLAMAHPDLVLVVAGDGPERGAIHRLPASVRERVVMLGNVPHDRLPSLHAASDVFCAPAIGRESFGIVLVEAFSSGVPVVASDIPGYREVVGDGVTALVTPPSDSAAVADAIALLLKDADLSKRLAEAGRQAARRYSWDTVVGEIETVYREVVDEWSDPGRGGTGPG